MKKDTAAIPKNHKTVGWGSLGSWWDFIPLPTSPDQFCRRRVDTNNQMFCASSALKLCKIITGNSGIGSVMGIKEPPDWSSIHVLHGSTSSPKESMLRQRYHRLVLGSHHCYLGKGGQNTINGLAEMSRIGKLFRMAGALRENTEILNAL